jgi:hypothetical protein
MNALESLKLWVGERHDYLESQYRKHNFATDEIGAACYRSVFEAIVKLQIELATPKNPPTPKRERK